MCSFAASHEGQEFSSLEEAVLFLDITETVITSDTMLSAFTWAALSDVAVPAAQTLKAVMLLMASARGYWPVCRPLAPRCQFVRTLLNAGHLSGIEHPADGHLALSVTEIT